MPTGTIIRHYVPSDWPAVWKSIEPVFSQGETYAYSPTTSENEAHQIWIERPAQTFVAERDDGDFLGTYYIKPNQPELGAHVCNCGYIVSAQARGQGVASLMCQHSQQQALSSGFRAMQYNLVVSTNEGAIRLWKKHGFHTVGILPGAFQHPTRGDVDALIMFKALVTSSSAIVEAGRP